MTYFYRAGGGGHGPLGIPGSATEKKCVMWSREFWPFWQVEAQVSWSHPSYWCLSLSLIGRWKSSPATCYKHNTHLSTRTTTTVTMLSRCRSRDGVLRKQGQYVQRFLLWRTCGGERAVCPLLLSCSSVFFRHGYSLCVNLAYAKIVDANFKIALWIFTQQWVLKCVEFQKFYCLSRKYLWTVNFNQDMNVNLPLITLFIDAM